MAGIKSLLDWNMVHGLKYDVKTVPDPVIEPCLAGKIHADPLPPSILHSTCLLELVHTDVHHVTHLSFSGYHY